MPITVSPLKINNGSLSAQPNTYYAIEYISLSCANDADGTGERTFVCCTVDGYLAYFELNIPPPVASKGDHLEIVFPTPLITDVNTQIQYLRGTFTVSRMLMLYREVTVS